MMLTFRTLLLVSCALFMLNFSGLCKGTKLKPGNWHTTLELAENCYLPVDFILNKKRNKLVILNGSEEIELTNITTTKDSIFIQFDIFDSEIRAKIVSKTKLRGKWYNHAKKGNYWIAFSSINSSAPRYKKANKLIDVSGRWEVYFDYEVDPEKAIGLFENPEENSNRVTGTFLTETGDYRFLDGAVIKDSLYLSAFDGSHAFLFGAELKNDTLFGFFRSGKHYKTNWYGVRNDSFELTHPDSLTYIVDESPITFTLPGLDGEDYTYPNDATKDKVTILQITGTWCPNCWDESVYMKTLKDKHGDNLEIIALAFETPETLDGKIEKVNKYKAALGLDYTFLIGGDLCKTCAYDLFPQLNEIISFPTMIVIDKKGKVRKIHTGFSGPGTGEYYDAFVSTTDAFIESLIEE